MHQYNWFFPRALQKNCVISLKKKRDQAQHYTRPHRKHKASVQLKGKGTLDYLASRPWRSLTPAAQHMPWSVTALTTSATSGLTPIKNKVVTVFPISWSNYDDQWIKPLLELLVDLFQILAPPFNIKLAYRVSLWKSYFLLIYVG